MNSMTGYGRAKVELPVHLVSIEISSVNKRNLEVVFADPRNGKPSSNMPFNFCANTLIEAESEFH